MKKSVLGLFFLLFIMTASLASCTNTVDEERVDIVCIGFTEYDWTMNVIGDNNDSFNLIYLLDDGSDPHSFQPSISDIASVSDCDLFIYMGTSSDNWTKNVIENAINEDLKVLCFYDIFKGDLLPMSNSHCEDEDEGEHHHEDDGHNHTGVDEHFWLSLENAKKAVEQICLSVSEIDPENKEKYTANADNYICKLDALSGEYSDAARTSRLDTLVFADRFPYAYLARDYSLGYYSAYSGCSADSELSQERIIFLAQKLDEISSGHICVIETSDGKLAETVISQTNNKDIEILVFNSLQSVNKKQMQGGMTYLGEMEKNLELLKKALG